MADTNNPMAGEPLLTQEQERLVAREFLDQYYKRGAITYGVELQFLVPVLVKGQADPHPNDGRFVLVVEPNTSYEDISRYVVNNTLLVLRQGARVPAWTHLGPPYPKKAALEAMDEESQAVARMPKYSQWVVEAVPNLLLRRDPFDKNYTWVGIKVKSSKRDSTSPGHFDPIGNVIVALRRNLRVRVAPSTSLMVHIGERLHDIDSYEMCPSWFRVFCTLWWFVETHVFLLSHHSRRRNGKCLPLKEHSRLHTMDDEELAEELADGIQGADSAHLYQQMHSILPTTQISNREQDEVELIWRAKDAQTLTRLLLVDKIELVAMDGTGVFKPNPTLGRGSLGFQGFCEGADPHNARKHNDGETGTIEFRNMEGTLDPLLILNWVTVLIKLYEISRRGKTRDIMAIIAKSRDSYGGLPLLRDLGLEEQAAYFQTKVNHADSIPETLENLFIGAYQ
ncbi:hypothetical protein F4818DRAFT_57469 [Hypoxylon cercidicola]|nr:hypothetical protein F4818DRAFT_57469 [Hypoxylon cercidicola]